MTHTHTHTRYTVLTHGLENNTTYTTATPPMTTSTDATMGRVNLRFSQKASTKHTKGMIINLDI